jgi:hypothetical protein
MVTNVIHGYAARLVARGPHNNMGEIYWVVTVNQGCGYKPRCNSFVTNEEDCY